MPGQPVGDSHPGQPPTGPWASAVAANERRTMLTTAVSFILTEGDFMSCVDKLGTFYSYEPGSLPTHEVTSRLWAVALRGSAVELVLRAVFWHRGRVGVGRLWRVVSTRLDNMTMRSP